MKQKLFVLLLALSLFACVGEDSSDDDETDPGGDTDVDSGADGDADLDGDTDADSDSDTDTDSDSDADTDADGDTDADADTDTDDDTDTETDSDSDTAPGCMECDPYVCNTVIDECFADCTISDHCNSSSYCDDSYECVPELANGHPCTIPVTGEECQSGQCVEGVCCNDSCGNGCESCLGVYTGEDDDGQCLPVIAGTDPAGYCTSGFCDGGGGCVSCSAEPAPPGTGCPAPCTGCANGVCTIDCNVDGACQSQTIDCPAGFRCEIACGGVSSCEGAVFNCPETYACDVTCDGPAGCRNAAINCSAIGTCDLFCGPGSESCLGVGQTCGGNECRAICSSVPAGERPNTVCGSSCLCLQC